jgi:hypothetical protein
MSRLDSRARFLSRSGLGTCGFTEVMEQAFEVFAAMLFAIAAFLLIPAAWTAYTPRHFRWNPRQNIDAQVAEGRSEEEAEIRKRKPQLPRRSIILPTRSGHRALASSDVSAIA